MENITIGQIAGAIGVLTVLVGFFVSIYQFIKKVVLDKITRNSKRIEILEQEVGKLKSEVEDSKEKS